MFFMNSDKMSLKKKIPSSIRSERTGVENKNSDVGWNPPQESKI